MAWQPAELEVAAGRALRELLAQHMKAHAPFRCYRCDCELDLGLHHEEAVAEPPARDLGVVLLRALSEAGLKVEIE